MPIDIPLPALSAGMEDAVVSRWLKAEGDTVSKGDVLAEIETDKATMEIEAEADGRLGPLRISDGQRAAVGQVIASILIGDEEAVGSTTTAEPAAPVAPAAAPAVAAAATQPVEGKARYVSSPLARRLAVENGITLQGLVGSGPKGRIVRIDIERAIAAGNVSAGRAGANVTQQPAVTAASSEKIAVPPGIGRHETIPHSAMRRTIARRLLEAKTTIPHFYLNTECNIDRLVALRGQINEGRASDERISINDFVIKACAIALRQVPDANVVWTEEAILKLAEVDIAVAVATDGGLITPLVRAADQKSLGAISAEVKSLAARARDNRLKPDEYQGGGFSISNLGMYGVSSFSAIINPPQSAILAVGAGQRRPVEEDGKLTFATLMNCTLSVDHRSVDGALGAQLLAAFKAAIENPLSILV